jgi:hypothetical protein
MGLTLSEISTSVALEQVAKGLGIPDARTGSNAWWDALITQSARRTCSVLGPVSKRRLADSILLALAPLYQGEDLRDRITGAIEELEQLNELVGDGGSSDGASTVSLYRLVGPRVILHESGIGVVQGEGPDGQSILPDDLRRGMDWNGGVRLLDLPPEAVGSLKALGFFIQDFDVWVRQPEHGTAADVIEVFSPKPSDPRDGEGISIIDPEARVNYYRGRWRDLCPSDDGLMVGRRTWDFGDGRWCSILVKDGRLAGLEDLRPTKLMTAADHAWLLQCAIDHENGTPQQYSVSTPEGAGEGGYLSIFSPVPSWITRRWSLFGNKVERARGALATWRFLDTKTLHSEAANLEASLWLDPIPADGDPTS